MKMLSIVAVMAAAMLTGCATTSVVRAYPGAQRPVAETSQLVVPAEFDVKSIDGAKAGGEGLFSRSKETIIELLPGPHDIVARFYSPMENGVNNGGDKPDRSDFQALHFDAAAGARYAMKRRTESRVVTLFIAAAGAAEAPAGQVRVVEAAPAPPAAQAVAAQPKPGDMPTITPLDNLKQWWFYASPQERAQFRAWIDAK